MEKSNHSIVYFDNAATSFPKLPEVTEAVVHAMNTLGSAGRSAHTPALNASRTIFHARKAVSRLLGSAPDRTIFTSGATESLNTAILGLLIPEDHVITTTLEHNSVLRPLYRLRNAGMGLSIIPLDKNNTLQYSAFENSLRPNTKAVVCTHASNVTGEIVNIEYIASFCKKHGLLLIVDAAQSAGVLPISADSLGIDALCFTGHKGLLAPQGTGGLCVKENLSIFPLKVGGTGFDSFSENQPTILPEALEAGTANIHGIAGLLAGVEYIENYGQQALFQKEKEITERFLSGISSCENITVYRPKGVSCTSVVSLNIGGRDAGDVSEILAADYGICVRAGAHCAPLVHKTLGTERQGAVRFSFSFANTDEEIEYAIKSIREITK